MGYSVNPEHFRGMLCLLQVGKEDCDLDPSQPVDKKALTTALMWLRGNNILYQEYFALAETVPGYFFPTTVHGANAPLPVKTADIATFSGGQMSSDNMPNQTGLLCSVDDMPAESGHPDAQVRGLIAGKNIPRGALDMNPMDLDRAKRLQFDDPHIEHKLFPHLFPVAEGGVIQGHKGMTLGQYKNLRLLHVDRRWAHDKLYPFSSLTGQ